MTSFCTRCGAQQAPGAAFCPACGTPAAAAPPPQYAAPPPMAPPQPAGYQPQQQPPPAAYPPQQPPPYAAPPPRTGLSSNAKIGIVLLVLAVLAIGYFVNQNEREFQRNRRAGQTPVATGSQAPQAPAAPNPGSSAPGGEDWTRAQLIGRWSVRGCNVSMVHLRIDGTTYSTAGTQSMSGTWTFRNGLLTVVENGTTTALEIVSIGDEMVTSYQGRQQTWRRC